MSNSTSTDETTHVVYIVECYDGTYYTGYTTDVERRVEEHNTGTGARYTRGRTPVEVVYTETYETQSAAMSREYAIKQLRRPQKERLVSGDVA
ncbi:GIY-YIG nuclease family protein [Longibacter sp.]|uniref:GIY-YIG nuclease family protein n=1 Tax=Longibacter sp. TaxID=2045415 RepID=UPI003EC12395